MCTTTGTTTFGGIQGQGIDRDERRQTEARRG